MTTNDVMDNWSAEDKLNRKASADFLTSYLTKRYAITRGRNDPDAFVISIRAEWGYGKTFFLTKWAQDLEGNGYPIVRFDAWANDYSDDPLVGFISSIDKGLSDFLSKKGVSGDSLEKAISIGKKLIKPVAIGAAAVLLKHATGMSFERAEKIIGESPDDLTKNISEEVSSLLSKYADIALEEHRNKSETIGHFKAKLSDLVRVLEVDSSVQLPVFIFIDELDRCRPTYAIELLEAIKHLFGVPGIYFVVATNTEQLGHSIKAIYGSGFNSEGYLKRFFDQEYVLPSPDGMSFVDFVFDKYGLIDFTRLLCPIVNVRYEGFSDAKVVFLGVCDFFGLSLRDREQVASSLFAVLSTWPENESVHFLYLIFIMAIKHVSAQTFYDLSSGLVGDRSKFMATLHAYKKIDVDFFVVEGVGYPNDNVGKRSAIDIFWDYYSLSRLNLQDINNISSGGDRNFYTDICRLIMRGVGGWRVEQKSKLFDYSNRVRHAGQLI